MPIAPIQDIVADLRDGKMVVLVDEEDRENEGDLVIAADRVTPDAINFISCCTPSSHRQTTISASDEAAMRAESVSKALLTTSTASIVNLRRLSAWTTHHGRRRLRQVYGRFRRTWETPATAA